jgi:hypothetical protein
VLTGVIYGAIVVAWAAYLVPLALRRHDEASRSRSIERFSSAMRILAHRGSSPVATTVAAAGGDERVVVTPKRTSSRVLPPDQAPRPERIQVMPTRNRAAERAAAARRRRVLSLLVLLTVFMGLAYLVGLVPKVWLAGPVLLIVGFLVTARLSVRRARKPYWVEAPAPEQTSAVVVRRSPVRVDATREAAAAAEDPEDDRADDEPTITLTAAQRALAAGRPDGRQPAAVPIRTVDGGSLWDPVPITPPIRVADRPAPRTVRTIPLGQSGPAVTRPTRAAFPTSVEPQTASLTEVDEVDAITEEVPRVVNG